MPSFPSRDASGPELAHSSARESSASLPYYIRYQVKAKVTPLKPCSSPHHVSRVLRFALCRPRKASWNKLRGGRRQPIELREWIGEPVVTAPIDGANHTQPPRVQVASITPGVWYGEPATLVLLTVLYSGDPAIPKAVVDVHLSSADDHGHDQPVLAAWGPDDVVSEEQGSRRRKRRKVRGTAGANSASVSADVRADTRDDTVQHGTSRRMFTRKPIGRSPAGYSGVKFVLTPTAGSKNGLPTWIRLAVVYKCKGPVELDIDLKILKTWRRHILAVDEHQPLVWDQSEGFLAQAIPCSECSTPRCRDLGHAKKQFWYLLLNQSDLEHHSTVPFASNPSDIWFRTVESGGAVPRIG